MSELITMCVQEEERLKEEKSDMVHLTIGPNKKAFKKGKNIRKKKSKVMMYLTMGKMMKIRYNVIFATRKVTKK